MPYFSYKIPNFSPKLALKILIFVPKISPNFLSKNARQPVKIINAYTMFGKILWYLVLKLSSGKENIEVSREDNSVINWQNLPINNPKPDLHNINAHTCSKFSETPLVFYHPQMKIGMFYGQITVRNWWNLPISNPKPDLHNVNAHTKCSENPLIFTQVIIRKWKHGWTDR